MAHPVTGAPAPSANGERKRVGSSSAGAMDLRLERGEGEALAVSRFRLDFERRNPASSFGDRSQRSTSSYRAYFSAWDLLGLGSSESLESCPPQRSRAAPSVLEGGSGAAPAPPAASSIFARFAKLGICAICIARYFRQFPGFRIPEVFCRQAQIPAW